jgi:hypothetical protein
MMEENSVPSVVTADDLQPLLEHLEEAWNATRDAHLVDRLAADQPARAQEIYEFFVDLVEAELDRDRKRPEFARSDERTRQWLLDEGFRAAAAAKAASASSSVTTSAAPLMSGNIRPMLGLLKEETGEGVDALARALDVTPDFLVDISDHADVVPIQARIELAGRIERARGIDRSRTMAALTVPGRQLQRAASRDRPYVADVPTFAELVERSSLDHSRKQEWLGRV